MLMYMWREIKSDAAFAASSFRVRFYVLTFGGYRLFIVFGPILQGRTCGLSLSPFYPCM